ncbi:MAG: hypothetical protein K8S98_02130 [Planctomycetes bacterium]|nr:hypothetical protein [Planctomycetota bacterium]
MPTTTDTIRAKIDAFLEDIQALTRAAALEAVQGALSGGARAPRGRRVARRRIGGAVRRAAPVVGRVAKRGKRTTEDVAATGAQILAFVKAHPGCSSEQIKAGLGMAKKDIALPILRLRAEKRLKITGQKRGTKYFAGGAGPRAAAKPARKARRKMSPEHKKALLERLAKARAAKS